MAVAAGTVTEKDLSMAWEDEFAAQFSLLPDSAVAEQTSLQKWEAELEPELSVVPDKAAFFADELAGDELVRRRAANFMGKLALRNMASVEFKGAEAASLLQVARDYYSTKPETRQNAAGRLATDFRTTVFEILCASGHVSTIEAVSQGDGFYQYGYNLRAMYAHGALHARDEREKPRRVAENVNEFRIDDGHRSDLFNTHYFVEISRAPDDMDDAVAKSNGYDTKTWKGKLRCTSVDADGHRQTDEAAVAGFDPATRQRHDEKGARAVLEALELNSSELAATPLLGRAFWVKKERLPHRAASLAQLYDSGLGQPAFFGAIGKQGDYAVITEQSAIREQRLINELSGQLENLAGQLSQVGSCDEALKIMAAHAKNFAAELCGTDRSYDPAQFGPVAARHIEAARYYARAGDQAAYLDAVNSARASAVVYMCGMRLAATGDDTAAEGGNSAVAEKDCDYISKECPLCHAKNARTHETAKLIECRECKGFVRKAAPSPREKLQMAA